MPVILSGHLAMYIATEESNSGKDGPPCRIPMSTLEKDHLFPVSASNDPGELSKLALHAHH
jgi:hypothetical protein